MDRGYYVMYGPLIMRPPVLFVGYQPGGDDRDFGIPQRPPAPGLPLESYYATDEWKLAVVMRKLWGRELMAKSTGLNAIFFRSPRIKVYETEVPRTVRRDAAAFCVPMVEKLVNALHPRLAVVIGFRSLELFGPVKTELQSSAGRALVKRGTIGDHSAYATLHLSGARISLADLESIGNFVTNRLAESESLP